MSNSWKIYMLAIVSFLVGTSENIIAGILDMVASDMRVSVASAGQLITVFSLAYAFGTPILMSLTARVERRKLMIWALSLFFVGNVVAVTSTGYLPFMGSRVILALSTGVFVVVSFTVAAKLARPGKQGSAMATMTMGFSASLIIGVPLGRVIAAAYDWKMIFAGIGILGLLAMVAIMYMIPKTEGETLVPMRTQLKMLRNPKIAIALFITFFWIFGYSIIYTYISPYLLTITSMSEKAVSIGLFAFGAASLIGSKLGGVSSDKWGIPRTLIGGLMLHAGVLFLLAAFSQSAFLMFPLLMLWAMFAWSTAPTQQYFLITLSPEASGIMLSLNTSMMQLAMAAGAGIGGIVVSGISLAAVGWVGAVGVTVAVVLAGWTFAHSRNESKNMKKKLRVV